MNNQPIKRRNPFDKPKPELVQKHEESVQKLEEAEEEIQEIEQPVYTEPVIERKSKPHVRNNYGTGRTTRTKYAANENEDRVKYTSTMEVSLRRQIKIVCATRGIMFSQFIEDACREKLAREGER